MIDVAFRDATPQEYWTGKDKLLKRLKRLRAEHGARGTCDCLNELGLRMLDMAIVNTLVALRRLEEEA